MKRAIQRVLFVCGHNRLRSPTAEQLFGARPDLEVASAGLKNDADHVLGAELVAWAELIFVMEKSQRAKLQQRFRAQLKGKRVVCLDIPDDYDYMDPALVRLLEARVPRHL
ncbi:phosphotyrosine protein phosphatase [Lysobacter sp. 5GHs7-4]|uniref:low molecular weight protein tyrosine phosphatase family protein n=1 Tax=Lysobacter sp. 5GHs7-4 TaxID=2904253 RepID=UPI001E4B2643|nr:phosphotyrosine protein phosphatase [Lysobacter sp. 5GHs7-4]UHQ24142.1 phosphotyrosine protein phosphatase [Lysobacter sp. 5GHs7-4]